ncbi:UNVERIFIED_CONTAM: hypothetical protein K2H54_015178 [Gekko kuhli]
MPPQGQATAFLHLPISNCISSSKSLLHLNKNPHHPATCLSQPAANAAQHLLSYHSGTQELLFSPCQHDTSTLRLRLSAFGQLEYLGGVVFKNVSVFILHYVLLEFKVICIYSLIHVIFMFYCVIMFIPTFILTFCIGLSLLNPPVFAFCICMILAILVAIAFELDVFLLNPPVFAFCICLCLAFHFLLLYNN